MYYHKPTSRVLRELPNRLPGRVNTQWPRDEAMYRAEGYCVLTPDSTPIPDGYEVKSRTYVADGDDVREVVTLRTVAEGDSIRLAALADSLPPEAIDKYAAFYPEFEAAVAAAIQAGAVFDNDIGYRALIEAMSQLEGDAWTRRAVILDALWSDVVYAMGGTIKDAYDAIPALEYNRQHHGTQ